jgi:hypothetical protein
MNLPHRGRPLGATLESARSLLGSDLGEPERFSDTVRTTGWNDSRLVFAGSVVAHGGSRVGYELPSCGKQALCATAPPRLTGPDYQRRSTG